MTLDFVGLYKILDDYVAVVKGNLSRVFNVTVGGAPSRVRLESQQKSRPGGRLFLMKSVLPVYGFDAAQRRRRHRVRLQRNPHIMHVVRQVHRIGVISIYAPRRRRAPISVAGPAAVAVPRDVNYQVILAVVLELFIEGEAEPIAGRHAEVIGALGEDLEGRVAVEVGDEVRDELANVGMA